MKKWEKRKLKTWTVAVAVPAAALVIIIGAVAALRGRDSFQVEEPASISVNGVTFRWPAGVRLLHRGDHTYLKGSEGEQDMEDFPLVLEESGSLRLQKSMIWTQTREDKIRRLDYFSGISFGEEGTVLSGRQSRVEGADGFLYDGEDTYVFLEPVELVWNRDQRMELEPLTVVQVGYRQYVHIYGPGMEPVFEDLTEEEVSACFGGGNRVNLATDLYYMPNGTWRLLLMSMEVLEAVK